MNRIAKIISLLSIVLIFISSCNDNGTTSPYGELLNQPPYAALTDSIKQEPQDDKLYFNRAVLLNTNNFPEPAIADFNKAWSLKKDEKYAFGLSNLLLDKNPDSAIHFLQQALAILPNSFLLRLTLVRSLHEENKTEEALQLADQILLSNPDQVDVLKIKAELLEKKGNPAEAISVLEKAYSLTPYDIDLNYNLAYKYGESKNVKVIALCDSLIRIDTLENHAEPYYYKGIYYSNLNDKTKALQLFEQAIQHDYYFLNAHIEKGRILYDQKKMSDAIKTFQLANTISPKFPDAWYWMAKCQEALGQKEEAKLNYQRAYALDNSFEKAKEAAEKINN
jgi:tetratricopeptide (TPR) repeat protein